MNDILNLALKRFIDYSYNHINKVYFFLGVYLLRTPKLSVLGAE